MATQFEMLLVGADQQHLEAVANVLSEEFQRLDTWLSRFDPASEIARVNREAAQRPVRVDRALFALLQRCEQARAITDGYFDVTAKAGGQGLRLDSDNFTVAFTRPDVAIDLGGVGKGYALDSGFAILARFGIDEALLNGGTSSVLAKGDEHWPIDVRHPLKPEAILQRIQLTNRALSCSAARHQGQTDSDVVNPLTGLPIVSNDACVVLAASAIEAEIFSTACLAMGREAASKFLSARNISDIDMIWVEA